MASFEVPKSPSRSILQISNFLGADFTNSASAVDESRSPNCKNMIRDVPGKVRKCMGYHTVEEYSDKINGFHQLKGNEYGLVHSGECFYMDGNILYANANDERSLGWQIGDKVYIVDGMGFLAWDGERVDLVQLQSYVPTITIAKAPSGGGTSYESLNLLQSSFTELFYGTEEDTAYHLTFSSLTNTPVQVEVLDDDGVWQSKTEDTDFTVDRENGIITFLSAPGVSPITGEDNVKITASRFVVGYADRINKCSIGIRYGVNGNMNRLFLSGNPDYVNYDWYSEVDDPTYFPDTNYCVVGSAGSAIVGYSIINNYLATHKDEMETDQSIIMRTGATLDDDMVVFKIVNTLQGAGAISKYAFGYLANEPLFLTRLGVYAVTSQDITGDKYGQNRSFYLNGKLLEEPNLENAYACIYKDMYWLCVNGVCYILDGLQATQTDKSMPYATRQYAGFYRTNVNANCMWEYNGVLYFGTNDGKVCAFYTDKDALLSYSDNGDPIEAVWETPDLDGKLFYKNKTFRYMAVRLQSAVVTSVKIFVQKQGLWNFLKEDDKSGRYIDFGQVDFSRFSFSCDNTQKIVSTKLRVKKVDKARFKLVNSSVNEPFGLYDISFEYVENGNAK